MQINRLLTILRDLFMPQPRNACPHCGGIRCIGVCQFNEKQPVAAEGRENGQAAPQSELVPDDQARVQTVEGPVLAAEDQTRNCASPVAIISATVQKQK